ncbi:MAG: metallophosphoesterase family protein [Planctomycetota bacterium]|jgi:predicted phosphodiesterase
MKLLRNFALIVLAVVLVGCGGVDPDLKIQTSGHANPWTHLNLYNNPENFQFAIVSDRNGGNRPGVFAKAADKLNLLMPEFVMCVGDLIEGSTEDQTELDSQWEEFDSLVNKLQMPFFYLPGNHDFGSQLRAKKWRQRLGPDYYHFVYRDVLFLCLNTEDPQRRSISDRQIEYFRNVLSANKNVRWTLVFMHQPVWKAKTLKNWEKLELLLTGRPYTVFAGHEHRFQKYLRKEQRYYILSTTGAAGGDDEPADCRFDQIVWVTMTDDGPVLANLLLKGILTDQPCPQ